ncbi:MAG: hypothetical protein ACD_17C00089G0001 [uncultured bacterium]|nr:MAG: hypothetical protein ACD_17C00089G0001 [uncultured bacterium]OGN55367.1 MAG: hypothetical protein A2796_02400 [Chlamydiae bacterium RIFCSPHIGHO2_01_FULL_44_39]OGN57121.1 MAG: hypothetical protein A3C42_01770 [Chlamydiae bacterium RIFCSPHIGHO2_02_FULL_45_9]OGN59870.1 MAG: hypothetical protein A3D96_03715 [Chlamydiae bacterium RIFCSPHIGHO2_12_FULL_44_59]OGN66077.1 MAG: hypothetical protein A2978_04230 [Chlamydiae bacterium RIFCSPLOWO2_01_FULL_44_52]OGN68613.1 MAG: hypothetical protein A3
MKKHFLTGLIILLPIALTLMVIVFLFDLFTEPFFQIVGPLIGWIQLKLHLTLPLGISLFLSRLFSLIFLCLFICLLGMVTQLFLVRPFINLGNWFLLRIPFIKTVYKVSKDIFAALFAADGKKAFKNPVMVPFPSRPNECLGFEAGEIAQELKEKIKEPLVPVFVPTAPHPISGFLFFIPETDVCRIEMTNEEVVKFLVSCGMISPEFETERSDGSYPS